MSKLSEFFDDYFNVGKMVRSKREYKRQMARVEALPKDYRYVFKKIQSHMWMFASGSGYDMMKIQYDLIGLFEEGAATGRPVLEITGEDVAAFCDGLIRDSETDADRIQESVGREVQRAVKRAADKGKGGFRNGKRN
jgi:DNA-binding ferritin-like protein (Dps family)